MKDSIFHKLVKKVNIKKLGRPSVSEYAFSPEEIASLNEQNKQKIQELKQDLYIKPKKKEKLEFPLEIPSIRPDAYTSISSDTYIEEKEDVVEEIEEVSSIEEESISLDIPEQIEESIIEEEIINEEIIDEFINEEIITEEISPKNSFVHLSEEHQKLVMTKWNSINNTEIDKDIIEGKDLLNHNYTITYADSAARYIHIIRKKYEIVICYLIGFNNEKKGIYDKTIFSDKVDNEWKFLGNYIKLLEKIRNFKKQQ